MPHVKMLATTCTNACYHMYKCLQPHVKMLAILDLLFNGQLNEKVLTLISFRAILFLCTSKRECGKVVTTNHLLLVNYFLCMPSRMESCAPGLTGWNFVFFSLYRKNICVEREKERERERGISLPLKEEFSLYQKL